MKPQMQIPTLLRLTSCLLAGFCVFALPAAAVEDNSPKPVKYVAPDGFGGHKWGDLRSSFERLPEAPVGVAAAWMQPKEKQTDVTCVPVSNIGPQINGAIEGCDFQATLLRYRKTFEGGGTYVLSEYSIGEQGFRFGSESDGVVLHPVVYQFCANWGQTKKTEPPPNFDTINKFCGMKFVFQSETREQLSKLPDEYVTNYDRILERLMTKYGRPDGFQKRGKVVIETIDGDSSDPADRKFSIWRWCPAKGYGFRTDCSASVVLSLDPATGKGTVMYSTPQLWEFAYARENYGFKGDKLFHILHARK
jgi:hypothetical protein